MPTIFERLNTAMTGNGATGSINLQADNLFNISSTLQSFATNPPDAVGDLTRVFGDIRLPNFPLPTDFLTQLSSIRNAVPTDASGMRGGVLSSIAHVETQFRGEVGGQLAQALTAFERIKALAEIDFRCLGSASGEAGAPGAPPAAPAPAPGEPEAAEQPTALQASTAQTNTALDRFPEPFNVRSLLTTLHGATDFRRDSLKIPPLLPLFDDVRDPLDTLIGWESLTPAELRSELQVSLSNAALFVDTGVANTLDPLVADLTEFNNSIPAADLRRIADRLTVRLAELRAAVQSGNLNGTGPAVTEINALLDEYDGLLPAMTSALADAPELGLRLRDLAGDLDLNMAGMVSVLRSGGSLLSIIPTPSLPSLDVFETWLTDLTAWIQQIVDALDLSVIQEPIADIADATRDAAAGLQQAIVAVSIEVQAIFTQIEQLLDVIDIAAIQAQVETAIEQFREQMVAQIASRVAAAHEAIQSAIGEIDSAVDGFDPQQVIAALTEAVNSIAGVLEDPDVANAIGQIRSALEQAATQIEDLQFTPITDVVCGTIDGLTVELGKIDASSIPAPALVALDAAVSVLPPDLDPVTDPILFDFDNLIATGPIPVLEVIRAQPARLLDTVRSFEPGKLVGEQLSQPFNEILRELERFRPSQLLEPLDSELDALKQRLLRSASPAQLVAPLEQPFAQLQQALNSFNPDNLIAPIDDALSDAMERLIEILPVDETFDIIDSALGHVQRVVDSAQDVATLLTRIRNLMNGLLNARQQLEAWVDEVLDKVDAIPDTAPLQPTFAALASALDQTRADAISTRFNTGTNAIRESLAQAGGTSRLASLISAHRAVPLATLSALPASADKTAVLNALERFDPMLPSFGAPWQQLGALQSALQEADSELQTLLSLWDDRFHGAGSSLTTLRQAEATTTQLRAWANETLQQQFVDPLAKTFGLVEPAVAVVEVFVARIEALVVSLVEKLDALLLGPDSLTGIRIALGEIVDQLLNVDLDFLRDSVNSLFDNVRSKLDDISPAAIGEGLDQSFATVLDTISLDLILPPADVKQLDETYEAIVEKLRALDPAKIVEAVVQPLFDETVLPLLASFDLTVVIDAVIRKLADLDVELNGELDRVNVSYRAMLAAVPTGSGQGAAASVSV